MEEMGITLRRTAFHPTSKNDAITGAVFDAKER
jgi:hypothetical protein